MLTEFVQMEAFLGFFNNFDQKTSTLGSSNKT